MVVGLMELQAEIGLWDLAGDSYNRVGDRKEDSRRCYEKGLEIVEEVERWGHVSQDLTAYEWHLMLSLAATLASGSGEWSAVEAVFRKIGGAVFFNKQTRGNREYRNLCHIIVNEHGMAGLALDRPDWLSHVAPPVSSIHTTSLTKLKAEFGNRALDMLKVDFNTSDNGYPVPETYCLAAIVAELYEKLNEPQKVVEILPWHGPFGEAFFEWTLDELQSACSWSYDFLVFTETVSRAEGLLRRPDYKEFMEKLKIAEESHQRQEWLQMRQEKLTSQVLELTRPNLDATHSRLLEEKPWLRSIANPGSIVNSEFLLDQLKQRNWGEVVAGYCNAVEEELKHCIYKEYLDFLAETSASDYGDESERKEKPGSVLYFLAGMGKNPVQHGIWKQFVTTKMPQHKRFVVDDLPLLLSDLRELRNPSAHGVMSERRKAERARDIVMGTRSEVGLLERLGKLRSSQSEQHNET